MTSNTWVASSSASSKVQKLCLTGGEGMCKHQTFSVVSKVVLVASIIAAFILGPQGGVFSAGACLLAVFTGSYIILEDECDGTCWVAALTKSAEATQITWVSSAIVGAYKLKAEKHEAGDLLSLLLEGERLLEKSRSLAAAERRFAAKNSEESKEGLFAALCEESFTNESLSKLLDQVSKACV